ncbi:3672_t:CDS:2 [Entrophospora sp. SA101]|nr:14193_t:CDS:2 [Entrophospora candida]CAH1763422.1 3673_t:CDS:2 [Entrophospora sp. SA101]CAG8596016.1 11169_t:CDS:2 [Entrophospora candida]CAJ0641878.1 3672_t:CDS:2 [Entrophospora sp. SA101]CAJ0835812.1 953_t:CDS:2 [Entrophospora sp. SA101]
MSECPSSERIILNVGGIKYETYRSTLTNYPDTLLGTMFQGRNQTLLHPINGNEYFIDRNGRAFHYVLEFYRTGDVIWPNDDEFLSSNMSCSCCQLVTRQELIREFDYFQIPTKKEMIPSNIDDSKSLAIKLDGFVTNLIESYYIARQNYQTNLSIKFYDRLPTIKLEPKSIPIHSEPRIDRLMKPYLSSGYYILEMFSKFIETYIKMMIPDLRWSLDKRFKYEPEPSYYELKITSGKVLDKDEILKYSVLKNVNISESQYIVNGLGLLGGTFRPLNRDGRYI